MDVGVTGAAVASNITRLREAQGITYTQLSNRLEAGGRAISPLAIRRIEESRRRVDVDDLMALAVALGTNPNALLVPDSESQETQVSITGLGQTVSSAVLWGWLLGKNSLHIIADEVLFRRRSLPRWLIEQQDRIEHMHLAREQQYMELLSRLAPKGGQESHGND